MTVDLLEPRSKANAAKIAALQAEGQGYADLYRTTEAGPSGQRRQTLVGRVRYLPNGPDEFAVIDMTGLDAGTLAGYARWDATRGGWSMTAERYGGELEWLGWASSLAIGVDVMVNGEHAALGRHDSRRISSGWFTRTRGRNSA